MIHQTTTDNSFTWEEHAADEDLSAALRELVEERALGHEIGGRRTEDGGRTEPDPSRGAATRGMDCAEFRRQMLACHTVSEITGLLSGAWSLVRGERAERDALFGEWCARREFLMEDRSEG